MVPAVPYFSPTVRAQALRAQAATSINEAVSMLEGVLSSDDAGDAGLAAAEAAKFDYCREPDFVPSVAFMLGFEFAIEIAAELAARPQAPRAEAIAGLVMRYREVICDERRRLAEWAPAQQPAA